MKIQKKFKILYNPIFRVIITWIWFFIGAILTGLIIWVILGGDFSSVSSQFREKSYLAVYIEIVSAGLLPLIFTFICKDNLRDYGLTFKGLKKSLIFSTFLIIVRYIFLLLTKKQLINIVESSGFEIHFIWKWWYILLGIFAYGPLEVFFFVWLISNTDYIFKSENRLFSWGLIITAIVFAFVHILTTRSIYNAFYTGIIFFILGLIYKYSKNSIGPMIAWTIINGQVWFIIQIMLP